MYIYMNACGTQVLCFSTLVIRGFSIDSAANKFSSLLSIHTVPAQVLLCIQSKHVHYNVESSA